MKEIDFEMLKKRRKKVLDLRTTKEEKQHVGLVYELIVDGRCYPVMACFPVGTDDECADDKLKYLISGRKD